MRECYDRAQGRCVCERRGHGHQGRCDERLVVDLHAVIAPGGWLAVGCGDPQDWEAVCWLCYQPIE